MGVKLKLTVNPLEASIDNSVLKIYFFDEVFKEIKVPIHRNITFDRQCNFFMTPLNTVIGYLKNKEYIVIIRSSGAVELLTSNFVLLTRGQINANDIMESSVKVCFAGSLSLFGTTLPCYMAIVKNKAFLFSNDKAATILLDRSDPLNESIVNWGIKHDDVGTLRIQDNSTNGSVLWANFGLSFSKEFYIMGLNRVNGLVATNFYDIGVLLLNKNGVYIMYLQDLSINFYSEYKIDNNTLFNYNKNPIGSYKVVVRQLGTPHEICCLMVDENGKFLTNEGEVDSTITQFRTIEDIRDIKGNIKYWRKGFDGQVFDNEGILRPYKVEDRRMVMF